MEELAYDTLSEAKELEQQKPVQSWINFMQH